MAQVLRLGVRPKGGGVGGYFILIIPAGAEAPKVNNGDGTTKLANPIILATAYMLVKITQVSLIIFFIKSIKQKGM